MQSLIEFDVFDLSSIVKIDWEYALKITENLDSSAKQENRNPIAGKAAVRILGEYAAIAHHCAFAPKGVMLAVVVSPPTVWFCPSKDGLNGSFIEEYSQARHGEGIRFTKAFDLFQYTNVDARLDAWSFYAQMILHP
jgi:hypothetical protein